MELFMLIFWIVLLVVFVIIEAMTPQLVTIWFALGSFAALIANILHAAEWIQWLVFITVSAVAVLATRPLVKKFSKPNSQPTNADRCIGKTAVVTEEIDNIMSKGAVTLNGLEWSARSEDDSVIPKGSRVTVIKIDGVKLIVKILN